MSDRRSPRGSKAQLDLFAGDAEHGPPPPAAGPRTRPVLAADPGSDVRELARQMPTHLRMGTSSWSFPGWQGLVYDGVHSERALARGGLGAYARHPLFTTVGVDRSHYAPVPSHVFAEYAAAVPDGFRFLVKAHEACSLARFPKHPRYGRNAEQMNPLFLDASYAAQEVIGPTMAGLGDKLGVILFQFAPQPMELLGGPLRFADALGEFLARLPKGPAYAVEVRNPGLLGRRYGEVLADARVGHCINILGKMPPPLLQWQLAGNRMAPTLVIRWMLTRSLGYQEARDRYQPFDAIVDPDPASAQGIARLVREVPNMKVYVVVNNKAEGSAPQSIIGLARTLAAMPG